MDAEELGNWLGQHCIILLLNSCSKPFGPFKSAYTEEFAWVRPLWKVACKAPSSRVNQSAMGLQVLRSPVGSLSLLGNFTMSFVPHNKNSREMLQKWPILWPALTSLQLHHVAARHWASEPCVRCGQVLLCRDNVMSVNTSCTKPVLFHDQHWWDIEVSSNLMFHGIQGVSVSRRTSS